MSLVPFSISLLPKIEFGAGALAKVPLLAASYGKSALLVTGGKALRESRHWERLLDGLRQQGLHWETLQVSGEPSPQLVDDAVQQFKSAAIDVVIGIGGGSVLDTAKAIAGLLKPGNSVLDHLEGVGLELPYLGPATPFIAVRDSLIPWFEGQGDQAVARAHMAYAAMLSGITLAQVGL